MSALQISAVKLEPELLATLINNYLSEMTNIAIEYGETINKFTGDAAIIFFW